MLNRSLIVGDYAIYQRGADLLIERRTSDFAEVTATPVTDYETRMLLIAILDKYTGTPIGEQEPSKWMRWRKLGRQLIGKLAAPKGTLDTLAIYALIAAAFNSLLVTPGSRIALTYTVMFTCISTAFLIAHHFLRALRRDDGPPR